MRLSPVPVYFRDDPERAIALAAESSRTTHGAQTAVDACRYFAGLIVGALRGLPKQQLLAERFRSGALLAVNLGDDADTTGAIYGQLAGAHYGVDGIPAHWLAVLAKRDQVELLASRLVTEEE